MTPGEAARAVLRKYGADLQPAVADEIAAAAIEAYRAAEPNGPNQAWDGSPLSFWDAIDKVRLHTEVEGEIAVLTDVLDVALNALPKAAAIEASRLHESTWHPGDIALGLHDEVPEGDMNSYVIPDPTEDEREHCRRVSYELEHPDTCATTVLQRERKAAYEAGEARGAQPWQTAERVAFESAEVRLRDELTALKAENAKLQQELSDEMTVCSRMVDERDALVDQIVALQGKHERLDEALRGVLDYIPKNITRALAVRVEAANAVLAESKR